MRKTLYKRNAQGNIIVWDICTIGDWRVSLEYGLLDGKHIFEVYPTGNKPATKELEQRFNAKLKEGYKDLSSLRDNAPMNLDNPIDLKNYLNTYLPKDNTTLAGDKFCMLAKTLEDNKPFDKNSYFGQWKINGERCLIGAVQTNDMFEPIKLIYTSRRGTDWTDKLHWMDEIILPKIGKEIINMMLDEDARLDGELYLPGYNINDINHIIKDTSCPQHKKLQYWCYDIAIENVIGMRRQSIMITNLSVEPSCFNTKEEHLNNSKQFVLLPYDVDIFNITQAIESRNKYIDLGFEGLILRDFNAEYQFGKRNLSMLKYKKIYDGWFEIVDIQPQSKKDNLPLFILKNDINSETFECTINASHDMQEYFLVNKQEFIGQEAFVEYRERSGVKEVPFHAKIIKANK